MSFVCIFFWSFAMTGSAREKTEGLPKSPTLRWTDNASDLGLDEELVKEAYAAMERGAKEKKVPGSVAVIGRNGFALAPRAFGHAALQP